MLKKACKQRVASYPLATHSEPSLEMLIADRGPISPNALVKQLLLCISVVQIRHLILLVQRLPVLLAKCCTHGTDRTSCRKLCASVVQLCRQRRARVSCTHDRLDPTESVLSFVFDSVAPTRISKDRRIAPDTVMMVTLLRGFISGASQHEMHR